MKKLALFLPFLFLMALFSPAFAVNINVFNQSIASALVNTNGTYSMLNLTFNATTDSANITAINVTLKATDMLGNTVTANVSGVELRNESFDVIGFSSSWSTLTNSTKVTITNGFNVSSSNRTLYVYFRISRNATEYLNISANVTSLGILTSNSADNISIVLGANSTISAGSLILDTHVNATMTPSYVDTGVISQSFIINITVSGHDAINRTFILLPSEFSAINVTNLTVNGGSSYTSNCPTPSASTQYCENILGSKINITLYGGLATGDIIRLYLNANTSSSAVSTKVNVTIDSTANITNYPADIFVNGSLNLITQQLITVKNVTAIKPVAVTNDNDYWEFNFALNITANVSGLLQLRMNNWNCSESYILNLTNQTNIASNNTRFYALLYRSGTITNNQSVINNYNLSNGISVTSTGPTQLVNVVLRMVIPLGTPVSSNWWTTYWMIFRTSP